ncbi:hypothetical protein DPEC_G00015420 [Dallia pectoralis]|uniref:Uncharacterized protein n=1 Tax=Dallia pectoralis TaxID=75939 RepID=A0ACC2HMU2_DALPE|nr:hypothetical protein DPEC_G00015420 [Dallia pectoralis]
MVVLVFRSVAPRSSALEPRTLGAVELLRQHLILSPLTPEQTAHRGHSPFEEKLVTCSSQCGSPCVTA